MMVSKKVVSPVQTRVQRFHYNLELLDVLARFGSLRLPSVARLEFIPMKIGAGMTTFRLSRTSLFYRFQLLLRCFGLVRLGIFFDDTLE